METLLADRRDERPQASPYRPDEEERRFYYSGVRGSPMLVARTSGEKWTKVTDPIKGLPESRMFFALKQVEGRYWYDVVQEPPIAKKWHEGPALKQALLAHLSASCDWTSMQVMQCGSMSFHAFLPTVLLVSVAPGSLGWDEGIEIAKRCISILESFEVYGIDCEIMEMAAMAKYGFRDIDSHDFVREGDVLKYPISTLLHLTSSSGYPIRALDNDVQGTVGLHIAFKGQPGVYGLTCRHVVLPDLPPDTPYRHDPQGKERKIIQATKETIHNAVQTVYLPHDSVARQHGRLRVMLALQEAFRGEINATFRERLAKAEQDADCMARVMELLEEMRRDEDRVIGHVAYAAPATATTLTTRDGEQTFLRDWALCRLDKAMAGDGRSGMYVDTGYSRDGRWQGLKGIETFRRVMERTMTGGCRLEVVKRGAASNITHGTLNPIGCVRRMADGRVTYDLMVLPDTVSAFRSWSLPFAAEGDSGSAVFHGDAVIGIVSGGYGGRRQNQSEDTPDKSEDTSERQQEVDVALVTPIEWILQSIAEFTGLEPYIWGLIRRSRLHAGMVA